jgi:hypothetical protein
VKSDGTVRELQRLLLDGGRECWIDDYVVIEACVKGARDRCGSDFQDEERARWLTC